MRLPIVFATIFVFAVLIAGSLIGKDRFEVLTTSESFKATVVECNWVKTRRTSKTSTLRKADWA